MTSGLLCRGDSSNPSISTSPCEYWIFSDIISEIKAEKERTARVENERARADEILRRKEELDSDFLKYAPAEKRNAVLLTP